MARSGRWRGALGAVLMSLGTSMAAEVEPVRGAALLRQQLAAGGQVSLIAELARPAGTELSPGEIETARSRLEAHMAEHGVREVRALGTLPFVALEVDARQLEALLASGYVAAVATDRPVRPN
jgi:hypothetical protein